MAPFSTTLKHAWNAFVRSDNEMRMQPYTNYYGPISGRMPHRNTTGPRVSGKTIVGSIYTRLAVDVASIDVRHVRTDDQRRYLEEIDSGLNNILTLEANKDQAARAFRQDIAQTMIEEGDIAIVPIDTSISPLTSGGYDILTSRVGKIVSYHPDHVRINVYNDRTGNREEITLPKAKVAIVENPLYAVMNEPNSTLQRLLRKLTLLDAVDEQSASGKLDIIIQLPYTIKSETKRDAAEKRRVDIEAQLTGSKYGIAYADASEKITQLNRPSENNLMKQVEYLTTMLYAQLGLTEEVMNGTADEKTMLNYWNRTIEPMITAIVEAMRRSFLTKTARSQKQTIMFFKDPFKLVPINDIAEIADKFTRNEIMSSNEIRSAIGMAPSKDPKADELRNANMPLPEPTEDSAVATSADPEVMSSAFDEIEAVLDEALSGLGLDTEDEDEPA